MSLTMSIATMASSMKQQQVAMEVSARLMGTVKDSMEQQGEMVDAILQSGADSVAISFEPHLGQNVDIMA